MDPSILFSYFLFFLHSFYQDIFITILLSDFPHSHFLFLILTTFRVCIKQCDLKTFSNTR
jgi:hypothetical protein